MCRTPLGGGSFLSVCCLLAASISGPAAAQCEPRRSETPELGVDCDAPSITSHPAAQTVCRSGTATLTVVADGVVGGLPPYQWQVNTGTPESPRWCTLTDLQPGGGCMGSGGGGASHAIFIGVIDATLSITSLSMADARAYRCIVTNACGSVTSDPATLTICIGDFNCDGGIDGGDVESFFGDWESGNPTSDVNEDGGVDGADVEYFFIRWEAGC